MKLNVTDWNIIPYADAWTRQTEWFDALIRAKQAGEEYEKLCAQAEGFRERFRRMEIGVPLLHEEEDLECVASFYASRFSCQTNGLDLPTIR